MAKGRLKGEARKIPQSKEDVANALVRMDKLQITINRIQDNLNQQVDTLTKKTMGKVARLEAAAAEAFSGIEGFAGSRRNELTDSGKKKTIKLPTGHFGWRSLPLSVDITDEEEAIADLEAAGLEKAVRTKKAIDKEELKKLFKAGIKKNAKRAAAVLAETIKAIKSISMNTGRESFWVEPSKVKLRLELAGEGKIKATTAKSVK